MSGNDLPQVGTNVLHAPAGYECPLHLERAPDLLVQMPFDCAPRGVPGDITVTHGYSGYLLGRIIPKVGLGPWWAFIAVITEYDDAVEKARVMALAGGVRAWIQKQGDEYDPL